VKRLGDRVSAADDEIRAAPAQRVAQVGERVGEECEPVRSLRVESATVGVVLLENGRQSVGGLVFWREKLPNQARSRARERRDRTQEIAGSSPASSMMKPPQNGGFSLDGIELRNIQALGPGCIAEARR
jgi:hypothetical protein